MLKRVARHSAFRFMAVGVSNTILSFAVFQGLYAVAGVAWAAQVAGYAAGIAWSYFWNSRWTFRPETHTTQQLLRFVGTQLAMLTLSAAALGLAVDRMNFNPTVSWLAVMAAITVLNYALTRGFVFAKRAGD